MSVVLLLYFSFIARILLSIFFPGEHQKILIQYIGNFASKLILLSFKDDPNL